MNCFGEYQDTEDCRQCWQSSNCKQEAQALDNYWDELARYEWELINAGLWEEPYVNKDKSDSRTLGVCI